MHGALPIDLAVDHVASYRFCFFLSSGVLLALTAGQDGEYEDAFTEACFQSYLVTLRVKAEMVNDEMRTKNTIQRMTPIDVKTECDALLNAISKFN